MVLDKISNIGCWGRGCMKEWIFQGNKLIRLHSQEDSPFDIDDMMEETEKVDDDKKKKEETGGSNGGSFCFPAVYKW